MDSLHASCTKPFQTTLHIRYRSTAETGQPCACDTPADCTYTRPYTQQHRIRTHKTVPDTRVRCTLHTRNAAYTRSLPAHTPSARRLAAAGTVLLLDRTATRTRTLHSTRPSPAHQHAAHFPARTYTRCLHNNNGCPALCTPVTLSYVTLPITNALELLPTEPSCCCPKPSSTRCLLAHTNRSTRSALRIRPYTTRPAAHFGQPTTREPATCIHDTQHRHYNTYTSLSSFPSSHINHTNQYTHKIMKFKKNKEKRMI